MGLFKKIKKGLKKIVKGVAKPFKKIWELQKKGFKELKRFSKTGLGKLVIAAAAIYITGGLMAGSFAPGAVFGSQGLGSLGAKFGFTGATNAGAATAGASTSAAAGTAAGTSAAAGSAAGSASLASTIPQVGFSGGLASGATTGATLGASGGSLVGAGAGATSGGLLSQAGAAVAKGATAAGKFIASPGGALATLTAGQALQSAFTPDPETTEDQLAAVQRANDVSGFGTRGGVPVSGVPGQMPGNPQIPGIQRPEIIAPTLARFQAPQGYNLGQFQNEPQIDEYGNPIY
jgi:hypothetical protein